MTDDRVTLFHKPDYASTIVRLALESGGVPHDIVVLDIEAGDLAAPEYRAINPLGLIPALQTAEGPVFETAAILLWLVDRHPALGPGAGQPGRAAFLSWLLFVANTLHPAVMALLHPERPGGPDAAAAVAGQAAAQIARHAGAIDAMIARETPAWLSADGAGVLAFYIGILLRWARMLPDDPALRFDPGACPNLTAVLAAAESSPAARRVALLDGLGTRPFTAPEA